MFQPSLFSVDNFQSNNISSRTDGNSYRNTMHYNDNNHMRNIQPLNQHPIQQYPPYPKPMNNTVHSNYTYESSHDYPVNNSQNINDINFLAQRVNLNAFGSDIKPIINLSSINTNPFRHDATAYPNNNYIHPQIEDNHSNSTMSSNSIKNDSLYSDCADIPPYWEQPVMDRHYTQSATAYSHSNCINNASNIQQAPHSANHCVIHGDIGNNTAIPIRIINTSPSTSSDSNTATPNAVESKKGDLAPHTNIECAVCGAVCATRSVLIDHSKHYHKKICGYCGKKFARNSNLKEHIRIHTGFTPYVCSMCNRGFKQQHSLKDHVRTHTGEKPFQCQVCGKRFTVKNNLKVHMRVHTGEKPYQCKVCYKRFTQKGSLNTHLRKVHKVNMMLKRKGASSN